MCCRGSAIEVTSYRVGVLVSGRGSNLHAILEAEKAGELSAEVALVISNRSGAQAIAHATAHGKPVRLVERRHFETRRDQQLFMADELSAANVDLVVLAGFDQILCPEFIERFAGKVINIHPSLLPAFAGGLHAQRDALAYGVKISGCTVHFVNAEVDGGAIILQRAVPVLDDDTVDTLAARILEQEHLALPLVIRLLAQERIQTAGERGTRIVDQA